MKIKIQIPSWNQIWLYSSEHWLQILLAYLILSYVITLIFLWQDEKKDDVVARVWCFIFGPVLVAVFLISTIIIVPLQLISLLVNGRFSNHFVPWAEPDSEGVKKA